MPFVLLLLVLQNYVLKNGVTSRDTLLLIILMKIHQQAASSVHYTVSCKHNLVLLRIGKIIAWNMLSWLKLLIKLLLLHLVGCLYYCISDARSHKHQTLEDIQKIRIYTVSYVILSIKQNFLNKYFQQNSLQDIFS